MDAERALLRALLDLHDEPSVEPFLQRVLELAQKVTGAEMAYLAIGPGFASNHPRFWLAHAMAEERIATAREQVSTTLFEAAVAEGLVHSVDAQRDPRFSSTKSVRANRIRAVVCAALQPRGGAPCGVLYLAGAPTAGPFDDATIELAQLMARHLGPLAQRVLLANQGQTADPTRPHRARLVAGELVGQSFALAKVLEAVVVASAAPVPVLVTGPTGTGKTLLARVLHESTAPRDDQRPFVAVNASHLRGDQMLAELFGARRGAYTGLDRDRQGLVEAAARGTLFIDEVGTLDADAQARLLTFLQDGRYRRLGETEERTADRIRVICATNTDLDAAATEGRFRADLLYRIGTFRIEMPELRTRPEDIVPLAFALTDRWARRYAIRARPWSAGACAWLEMQPWPGNIRELENTVQRGLLWAHAEDSAAISLEHLERVDGADEVPPPGDDLRAATEQFKRRFVQRVLEESGGNKTEAARRLGVHRSHLHGLLRGNREPER